MHERRAGQKEKTGDHDRDEQPNIEASSHDPTLPSAIWPDAWNPTSGRSRTTNGPSIPFTGVRAIHRCHASIRVAATATRLNIGGTSRTCRLQCRRNGLLPPRRLTSPRCAVPAAEAQGVAEAVARIRPWDHWSPEIVIFLVAVILIVLVVIPLLIRNSGI